MRHPQDSYPACFGVLQTVFPESGRGLRSTPPDCLECAFKTACLRTAMEGVEGLRLRQGLVQRAYESGRITFWERWSRIKALERRINALKADGQSAGK